MKRFVTLALVSALVLGASSIVYANVCAFDAVPAATLLFPFVSLDYNSPVTGTSTTFSITNVSAEAQIIHVSVWSDFSAGVLDFNILLTGYDVISMNIRDILITGQLPVTKNEGHSGTEGVAVNGPVSGANTLNGSWLNPGMDDPQPTSALAAGRCDSTNTSYPGLYATPIPAGYLNLFKGYLQVSQIVDRLHSDECDPFGGFDNEYTLVPTPYWAGRTTADPTNMYITVDVAESCNKSCPDDAGYFIDFVREDNVLIGDVFWTNTEERFSEAGNAIHLEADYELDTVATIAPTGFPISFYHRYAVLQDNVSDYREPLPTAWAFRYLGWGVPDIGTDVRVWKGSSAAANTIDLERIGDPISPSTLVASNCHAYTYYAWDEDEMVTTVTTVPWSGGSTSGQVIPNLIPLETQEVPIDQFDAPGAFGWMLFVWPASNYPAGPTIGSNDFYDYFQTWMGVKYNAAGQWSAAMDAAVMANYNCFSDQILPNLGVNYNYVDANGYVTSPLVGQPVN